MKGLMEKIAHHALKSPASHYVAIGLNGKMAVAAMTAVINGVRIALFGNFEKTLLIEEKRPEVIFEIEYGARILMLLKFLPYSGEELPVVGG